MQIDLFDVLYEDFRFNEPLKTITLFSGIGFQEMGMDLAEIPYKMIGTSEIDKFAILSYAAINTDYLKIRETYNFPDKEVMVKHLQDRNVGINLKTHKQTITNSTNEETVKDYYLASVLNKNLGDISKVKGKDIQRDIDLLTYSFPCTDLSKAGQQAGLSCGTRSGLVYEVLRILYELKEQDNLPKVLIMENVIDLIQVKFVDEWNKIALEIEQMGYTNFTQVLNGKDYGVAQNRRRVFMVSILGDYNYNFPQSTELKYRLKDYLENDVDESYYLSDKMIDYITNDNEKWTGNNNQSLINKSIASTINTGEGSRRCDASNYIGDDFPENFNIKHLRVNEATKQGYALAKDGMIQTIKTGANDVGVVVDQPNLRIRKLTPTETGRLMGMQDYQINKQNQVSSNAQMYKQHGNGIIAQVMAFIIGMMWYEGENKLRNTIFKNSFDWIKEDEKC